MMKPYILVIEDGEPIRNLLKGRLEKDGFEVKGAGKVADALMEIRTKMPDLIILDLTFDDDPFAGITDGISFLGMLRRNHEDANPAIIIFSANPSPQIEAKAKAMGVHTVLGKKAGVRPLLDAIQLVLKERKETAVSSPIAGPAS